jgi:hypothetical protein
MQWQEVEAQWDIFVDKAKRYWKWLDHAQLKVIDGKFDRLVDHIQGVYRIPRMLAEQEVSEWLDTLEFECAASVRPNVPRRKSAPGTAVLLARSVKIHT